MTDPRVMELLEEILETGRTPEEACAGTPELLREVREGLRRCRSVDAEVDAIFPASRGASAGQRRVAGGAAAELPLIPGYEVESVLGRGGMGVVYLARQLKLNRRVALKMVLAGAYARPSELTRFLHEAEAVASLRHAHVVQVHDVGDLDGLPYFTMEYVEGGTLGQKLTGTPQPAHLAAELVATLARAVHAAHEAGIVHRDLKPGNVLLAADGTPKITDFGLARHFGEDQGLTLSGVRVGTPSYMAPEQAAGRASAAGPPADVYSLGAILYELLTGRPPFRAETAAETVQQVIYREPAPPSRLNAKVPRDLETVCLKCLHKEPERRYATAAALADDLTYYRTGRPIRARPPGWGGRLWRWSRREPAAAAFVATALGLVGLTVGGGFWVQRQRAVARASEARQEGRTWQAVEAALSQAVALQKDGHWPEARATLKGSPTLLGTSAPPGLRERLHRARADADMVTELEEIRLRLSEGSQVNERESPAVDRLYAGAFAKYGIDLAKLEPAEAAARVRNSDIREFLLAFLHDWLYWVPKENRDKLRAAVERADDDPWRRSFREALAGNDNEKLKALASTPEGAAQPPVILSGLAGTLLFNGQRTEAWALLREAQQNHPGDFWINYLLGHFLEQERPLEAVGYFRAAVAIRPASDQAYVLMGRALRNAGDVGGAAAAFHKAILLNPNHAYARDLVKVLAPGGRLEEARVAWEKVLDGDPPDYDSWYGYPQLCLFLGNEEAYRRSWKAMLDRSGDRVDDWVVAERTGLAGLLLPAAGEELRRAVVLADRAAAAKSAGPDNPYVQFVRGLAEYRQGRPGQAIPLLQEAAANLPNRPGPRLALAMAQFRSGSRGEARATLATAIRTYDWRPSRADYTTAWVSHVLRREAEAMILPEVPAFLRGEYQPRENDERMALQGVCQFQGRNAAAALLFADAFAADPGLADELTAECLDRAAREGQPAGRADALNSDGRYLAARSAALAGCGLGSDGTAVGESERGHWRKQAREWLRADLVAWTEIRDNHPDGAPDLAKEMLTLWQADPDLARLRDPDALENLSAEERKEWTELWHEVRLVLREAR